MDDNNAPSLGKEQETRSFEEAFAELEEVVASLESGELDLDRALSLYERGKILAQYCSKLLDQAELRVKLLTDEHLVDFKVEE
jgi:exodeoxyribonuclease VII small subunit